MKAEVLSQLLKLKTNRERQIPAKLSEVEITHKKRYEFIQKKIKKINGTIIDYGCGSGYGTKILSKVSEKVIGVDNSEKVLTYAKKVFSGKNISYKNSKLTNQIKKADVIVNVEMIEHISKKEGEKLIKKFYNLLKEKGLLIITTPRKPYGNPFHIHEYKYEELCELLEKKSFKILESYGQAYTKIKKHKLMLNEYKKRDKYTMIIICEKN